MTDVHETHVCRDCGAEITMPYVRGWWSVAPDDAERFTPDLLDTMRKQLADAMAAGKQIVAVEGITLTWHDA